MEGLEKLGVVGCKLNEVLMHAEIRFYLAVGARQRKIIYG